MSCVQNPGAPELGTTLAQVGVTSINRGIFNPTSFPGLLDILGVSAAAAYSVRLLTKVYTGKCCNIRRSSDNTAMDIGFTTTGDFDSTTFSTFIGAGNGFVTKWYDQSGNGHDASQATAANQPQLVLNATPGGKPALKSATTTQLLTTTLTPNQPFTLLGAGQSSASTDLIWQSTSGNVSFGFGTADNAHFYGFAGTVITIAISGTWQAAGVVFNGASGYLAANGAVSSPVNFGANTPTAFEIGVADIAASTLYTTEALLMPVLTAVQVQQYIANARSYGGW